MKDFVRLLRKKQTNFWTQVIYPGLTKIPQNGGKSTNQTAALNGGLLAMPLPLWRVRSPSRHRKQPQVLYSRRGNQF